MDATFGATASKDFAAVRSGHTFTETVLVYSLAVGGLECSLHCSIMFLLLLICIVRSTCHDRLVENRVQNYIKHFYFANACFNSELKKSDE